MAKRRGRPPGSGNRVTAAAKTVGGTLGSLVSRADAWLRQRDQLVAELRAMADNIASGGKAALGSALKAAGSVASVGGARKRRTMSAAARAKIGAAQRARWAKQKAAAGVQLAVKSAKKAKKR